MFNSGYWFGERKNFIIYVFLFSSFLLILLIPTVYGFLWSESINVDPRGTESLTLNRTYGELVNFRIWSINGTYDDSINIWVTNPNGDTILHLGRVKVTNRYTEFEFPTWQDGGYTVHFDNSFSSSPKTVEYMWMIYMDTFRPTYYAGLAMWLILPPIVKHILGYEWFKTLAISLGTLALVMFHLFFLAYINEPLII